MEYRRTLVSAVSDTCVRPPMPVFALCWFWIESKCVYSPSRCVSVCLPVLAVFKLSNIPPRCRGLERLIAWRRVSLSSPPPWQQHTCTSTVYHRSPPANDRAAFWKENLTNIANNNGSCRLIWAEVNSLTSWVDLKTQAQSLSPRHWYAEGCAYFTWQFPEPIHKYLCVWGVGGWAGHHLYDRCMEADITGQWFSKGITFHLNDLYYVL